MDGPVEEDREGLVEGFGSCSAPGKRSLSVQDVHDESSPWLLSHSCPDHPELGARHGLGRILTHFVS